MTVLLQKTIEPQKDRELSAEAYDIFAVYLKDSCGILLGSNKQYLVKNRLGKLLRESEYDSLERLVFALKKGTASNSFRTDVLDVMTTNETFWFRDASHFEILKKKIFPELVKQAKSTFRVWSAACSSGQEPYSISISFDQFLRASAETGKNLQIIGTDISQTIIGEASNAVYNNMSLSRGISPEIKKTYFSQFRDLWRLNAGVSARVSFQKFNLLNGFEGLGKFDLIFIRNVLIYFPEETKRNILERIVKSLAPGGYLFLSSTESLPTGFDLLVPVRDLGGCYYRLR